MCTTLLILTIPIIIMLALMVLRLERSVKDLQAVVKKLVEG
jgi:hypothetical protein